MTSIITFTTDFGTDSPYVAQMKASALSLAPASQIVDVTHRIGAQNVMEGAIVLSDSAFFFPAGTIHVAVVDPGVGTDREIVTAQVAGHWFIAPDNGLLTGVLQEREVSNLRTVANKALWRSNVSQTFHGRDIMAPVAAHLVNGTSAEEIGPSRKELITLHWPTASEKDNVLHGDIVYVDSFGNLITNIHRRDIVDFASCNILVQCADVSIDGITSTYGDCEAGALVALFGSSDRLEIAITQGNAARQTGLLVGQAVVLTRR